MKKKTILLLLAVMLITAMACNITDLIGMANGEADEEEDADEMISELARKLTEAAEENQASENQPAQEEEEEEPVQQEQQAPTNTPLPTAPPLPTNTPAPTQTPIPSNPGMISELDYKTDFTFSDGWYDIYISEVAYPEYEVIYNNDNVQINVETEQTYIYMMQEDLYYSPGQAVYVEATIEVTDGPYDNNLGVVCRVTNDGWYEYLIRTNGYWDLYIYDYDDGYQFLDTGGSWDINMKHDINTIGMLCDGNALTLYINGKEIKTVRNDRWDEGGVGLNVGTLGYGGSEFEVTSFIAVNNLSLVNLPN